jgi:hypothetical protein
MFNTNFNNQENPFRKGRQGQQKTTIIDTLEQEKGFDEQDKVEKSGEPIPDPLPDPFQETLNQQKQNNEQMNETIQEGQQTEIENDR